MSNPRYVPREFLVVQAAFGRPGLFTQWKRGDGVEYASQLRASQLQHAYAVRIREMMKRRSITRTEYAKRSDMSYDRFVKVLRGAVVMRIEDLAMADLLLGGASEFDRSPAKPGEKPAFEYEPTLPPPSGQWKLGRDRGPTRRASGYSPREPR